MREARTAADGTFSVTAPSGKYFIVAESLDGTRIAALRSITLAPGGSPDSALSVGAA